MGETCATCRFYLAGYYSQKQHGTSFWHNDQKQGYGDCRIRSVENFPRRRKDDWCGERKPKDGADHG
jgi:hypothetical protein